MVNQGQKRYIFKCEMCLFYLLNKSKLMIILIREYSLDRDEIVVATKVDMVIRPGILNGGGLSRNDEVSALGIKLSEDEIIALEKSYVPHPVLGLF